MKEATAETSSAGRLHVVEVGLRWPPEGTFLLRKLEGLVASGVEMTVASPVTWRTGRRWRSSGIRLVRLRSAKEWKAVAVLWVARDMLVLGLRAPRELRRVLRSTRSIPLLRNALPLVLQRPDVLHFEWEQQAIRYRPLVEVVGVPFVVSCRGNAIYTHPHTGFEQLSAQYPLVFAEAAAVHCVSAAICLEATRHGLDPAKGRVIRSGVDTARFSPGERPEDPRLRVISVGQLKWVKNHDDGIKAVALLVVHGVPVSYEIAGGEPPREGRNPSDRARLLYLIHDLGLEEHVRLLGRLSHDGARDLMRRSDVLLLPSLSEGIANCVLEAMACALPVVVADCGGMTEAVTDGVEGLVCPRRSPEALAAALHRIWAEPGLARRLGDAGRRRIASEFTVAAETAAYRRLYTEVAERGGERFPTRS
jgi:glycosyltransferase involved in cell wall biosynthesis